ncbi:unnamed protein product [Vitrella brassicaformis CCMP3155]|uniref:Uncharacterized protein n=2 Tax=Vitrella brassicaformis TaxID=1169539 RepID=A0A0G4F2F3_VITBC|nr:unnamed protein product [Vitrella brassicaformis CCMP3155]|eukprot:CEM05724.1 unnamed protein product [Vitrella brassicaformis CCMP3155]
MASHRALVHVHSVRTGAESLPITLGGGLAPEEGHFFGHGMFHRPLQPEVNHVECKAQDLPLSVEAVLGPTSSSHPTSRKRAVLWCHYAHHPEALERISKCCQEDGFALSKIELDTHHTGNGDKASLRLEVEPFPQPDTDDPPPGPPSPPHPTGPYPLLPPQPVAPARDKCIARDGWGQDDVHRLLMLRERLKEVIRVPSDDEIIAQSRWMSLSKLLDAPDCIGTMRSFELHLQEPTHDRSAGDIPWVAQVMELLRSYGVGVKSLRLLPRKSGFVSGYLYLKPTRLVRALLLGSESKFREYVSDMVAEMLRIEGCRPDGIAEPTGNGTLSPIVEIPPAITPAPAPVHNAPPEAPPATSEGQQRPMDGRWVRAPEEPQRQQDRAEGDDHGEGAAATWTADGTEGQESSPSASGSSPDKPTLSSLDSALTVSTTTTTTRHTTVSPRHSSDTGRSSDASFRVGQGTKVDVYMHTDTMENIELCCHKTREDIGAFMEQSDTGKFITMMGNAVGGWGRSVWGLAQRVGQWEGLDWQWG